MYLCLPQQVVGLFFVVDGGESAELKMRGATGRD